MQEKLEKNSFCGNYMRKYGFTLPLMAVLIHNKQQYQPLKFCLHKYTFFDHFQAKLFQFDPEPCSFHADKMPLFSQPGAVVLW